MFTYAQVFGMDTGITVYFAVNSLLNGSYIILENSV